MLPEPQHLGAEAILYSAVQWIRLGVEAIGATIIVIGIVTTVIPLLRTGGSYQRQKFDQLRLKLARHMALALEFQLGADILSTAVAPSWDQIGKLGAIAVIRTGLNYFLVQEMKTERVASQSP